MTGPRAGTGAWSVVVSLLVVAAMTTIAVVTVARAGCENPGRYVVGAGGYELVGGCIEPDDLPVTAATSPTPPVSTFDQRAPLRP